MDEFRIRTRILDPLGAADRKALEDFLVPLQLDLERDVETAVVVEDDGVPIATACLAGDVIKCVGVRPGREGEGAGARVVSAIMAEAHAKGRRRLFVYTSPGNKAIFENLGFTTLTEISPGGDRRDGVALLENDTHAFENWAAAIRRNLPEGKAEGAVVVNCNPFTLGHRYLIEKAAALSASSETTNGTLLVLVLAGDRSSFPATVREALVRAGTADLGNVVEIGRAHV